jgi:hypothetical protein
VQISQTVSAVHLGDPIRESKIFFSHASEDKEQVVGIAAEFVAEYPEMKPWIDTYEIVGGDSLLDKIAQGMDDADKFVVFLSPISIKKPWVNRELNRAIMHEISGIKPNYIVPVLVGPIEQVPAFLEEKKYVPVFSLTRAEWLLELKASIDGAFDAKPFAVVDNLEAGVVSDKDRPNVGTVLFTAKSWAVDVSFHVRTREKASAYGHRWLAGGAGAWNKWHTTHGTVEDGSFYVAYAIPGGRLLPGDAFALRIRFPKDVEFDSMILSYSEWDGSGGFNTIMGDGRDSDPLGRLGIPGVDGPDDSAVEW